jgi:deoxyribodipyrimidine photo-lyase
LQYYLWDKDLIADYFNTRNGMVGGDYSTKFSPWLAAGCLSPRRVHHEVRRYERARTENKSTYWVIFELIWRDYFRFFAVKHGSKIFFEDGIIGKQLQWASDPEVRILFWRTCAHAHASVHTCHPLLDSCANRF